MLFKKFIRRKPKHKFILVSAEKYKKDVIEYMNSTYAKKFNDELTLKFAFF